MPILKLCSAPCCKTIISDGSHRCIKHRTTKRKAIILERGKFYNTTAWVKLSRMLRQQRPICEICNEALTEAVDHWLEISMTKGEYNFNPHNLICMCNKCHSIKSSKLRRMILDGDVIKQYQELFNSHPRQDERDYLSAWAKERTKETK